MSSVTAASGDGGDSKLGAAATSADEAKAASATDVSPETAAKICKQVEFYFSVHNLPRDKFLKANMDGEGWVSLEVMLKFNRLRAISDSSDVIAAALASSDVMVVSDDKTKIKRAEALSGTADFSSNIIYAKGFPDNAELEEIESVFQTFGNVGRVDMRRIKSTQAFKGSVFVTFTTKESAEKAIAGPVKFMGKPLEKVMWRSDYFAMKRQARAGAGAGAGAGADEDAPKYTAVTRVDKGLLRLDLDMDGVSQHEMRNEVQKYGDLKFFEVDAKGAVARFGNSGEAETAMAKLTESKVNFSGQAPTLRVLEGEEAAAYWDKVESFHKQRWTSMQQRKRGGGRSGRGRGGKRRRDHSRGPRPAKSQRTE